MNQQAQVSKIADATDQKKREDLIAHGMSLFIQHKEIENKKPHNALQKTVAHQSGGKKGFYTLVGDVTGEAETSRKHKSGVKDDIKFFKVINKTTTDSGRGKDARTPMLQDEKEGFNIKVNVYVMNMVVAVLMFIAAFSTNLSHLETVQKYSIGWTFMFYYVMCILDVVGSFCGILSLVPRYTVGGWRLCNWILNTWNKTHEKEIKAACLKLHAEPQAGRKGGKGQKDKDKKDQGKMEPGVEKNQPEIKEKVDEESEHQKHGKLLSSFMHPKSDTSGFSLIKAREEFRAQSQSQPPFASFSVQGGTGTAGQFGAGRFATGRFGMGKMDKQDLVDTGSVTTLKHEAEGNKKHEDKKKGPAGHEGHPPSKLRPPPPHNKIPGNNNNNKKDTKGGKNAKQPEKQRKIPPGFFWNKKYQRCQLCTAGITMDMRRLTERMACISCLILHSTGLMNLVCTAFHNWSNSLVWDFHLENKRCEQETTKPPPEVCAEFDKIFNTLLVLTWIQILTRTLALFTIGWYTDDRALDLLREINAKQRKSVEKNKEKTEEKQEELVPQVKGHEDVESRESSDDDSEEEEFRQRKPKKSEKQAEVVKKPKKKKYWNAENSSSSSDEDHYSIQGALKPLKGLERGGPAHKPSVDMQSAMSLMSVERKPQPPKNNFSFNKK